MDKSKQILELHLKHQMKLVSSENLKNSVNEEVKEFTKYYYNKKLKDVLPPERLQEITKDSIQKFNLNDKLLSFLKKILIANQEIIKFENETLDAYINKSEFLKAAEGTIGLKDARNKFINFAVHSSAYARMISSIIMAAIKDFMMENPLTKNNPIGGAFLKIGGDLLNNLPGMQGNFESKVNDFISQNLSGRIKQSENLIQAELDSEKSKEIVEEFWVFLSKIKLSETPAYIDPNSIDKLLSTFPGFFDHLKKSGFVERYLTQNINSFYKEYSDKEFSILLDDLGITKDVIDKELTEAITPILDTDNFKNFYKSTVERRLSEFYNSPELKEILGEG